MAAAAGLLLLFSARGEVFEGDTFSLNSWHPVARFVRRLCV